MRNNITYHKEGDYLIPDLTIENDNKNYHIGKYGHLRLKYLKEHKRGFYTELIMIGQLANHLSDVDKVATKMVSATVKKLAKQEGINEARFPLLRRVVQEGKNGLPIQTYPF